MLHANKLCFFSVTVSLFVLSSILMLSVSGTISQKEAVLSVSEAEQSVVRAYKAVLDAERVGANVSSLLVSLNNATGLLSEARMSIETGNFEKAVRFAALSSEVGNGVGSEAERLTVEASQTHAANSWWSLVESGVVVVVVLCASVLGYRYFKRRYYMRLLKMRPRVG